MCHIFLRISFISHDFLFPPLNQVCDIMVSAILKLHSEIVAEQARAEIVASHASAEMWHTTPNRHDDTVINHPLISYTAQYSTSVMAPSLETAANLTRLTS